MTHCIPHIKVANFNSTAGKRGFIDGQIPPIMKRLQVDTEAWALAMRPRGNVFGRARASRGIGHPSILKGDVHCESMAVPVLRAPVLRALVVARA